MCVTGQFRQGAALGQQQCLPHQVRAGCPCARGDACYSVRCPPIRQCLRQLDQSEFHLTCQQGVGQTAVQQIIAVEPGIEAKEAEMGVWISRAHTLSDIDPKAQSSVHRDGERHQLGARGQVGGKWVHRQVYGGSLYPCRGQGSQRPGQAERLVTEFITRQQENGGSGHFNFLSRWLMPSRSSVSGS